MRRRTEGRRKGGRDAAVKARILDRDARKAGARWIAVTAGSCAINQPGLEKILESTIQEIDNIDRRASATIVRGHIAQRSQRAQCMKSRVTL